MDILIDKVFTVSLVITDPINFVKDIDIMLMTQLKQEYENRCYKDSYIAKIDSILERSKCRIINTNITGHGAVDVKFSAKVICLKRGDVITGAKVVNTVKIVIMSLKTETIFINIAVNVTEEQAAVIKVDDVFPVIVMHSKCDPKSAFITCTAVMFHIQQHTVFYRLIPDDDNTFRYNILIDNIKQLLDERSDKLPKEVISILFKQSIDDADKQIDIFTEIDKIVPGKILIRRPTENLMGHHLLMTDKTENETISISYTQCICMLLNEMYNTSYAINSLSKYELNKIIQLIKRI